MIESTLTQGDLQIIVDYKNGSSEEIEYKNTVLDGGKRAIASALANEIGNKFESYIAKMLFGDGGTLNGVPRFVDAGRNGLFGITRATKPIISSLDVNGKAVAIFTSILTFEDANDNVINEMALQMANGNLYSMITFADLTKTSLMQITFNWRLQVL